jgi:transposase
MMIICPKCRSEKNVKDGFMNKKQRYFCKGCKYRFTLNNNRDKFKKMKKQAITLYLEGMGMRSIGRFLGVSHVSVYYWIRKFGNQLEKTKTDTKTENKLKIVEMDEMHTYVKSKKNIVGSGLQ